MLPPAWFLLALFHAVSRPGTNMTRRRGRAGESQSKRRLTTLPGFVSSRMLLGSRVGNPARVKIIRSQDGDRTWEGGDREARSE